MPGLFLFDLPCNNQCIQKKINIEANDICHTDGYIHDLNWISPGKLIVATSGEGYVSFFNIESSIETSLTKSYNIKISNNIIRQIAVDNFGVRIASGGYEGNLIVSQISDSFSGIFPIANYKSNDCIGSIKWHPTDHQLLSFTTDNGFWNLYDLRSKLKQASFETRSRFHHDQVSFISYCKILFEKKSQLHS